MSSSTQGMPELHLAVERVWKNETLINGFVNSCIMVEIYRVETTTVHHQGRFFQLGDILGVEREMGYSLSTDKYFN